MSAPVVFRLGSFSAAGEPPFAGLVLGERVYAAHGLVPLERCRTRRTRGSPHGRAPYLHRLLRRSPP